MALPAIPAALGGITAAARGAQMARGAGMAAGGIGGLARMARMNPMIPGLGLVGTAALYDATDGFTQPPSPSNVLLNNPEELGRYFAQQKFSIQQALQEAQKNLKQQFVEDPRNYLELVQYGYTDETDKLQNPPPPTPLRGMGAPPPPPPEPPARMAEGGPMFMRNEPNIFSIDADIANLMTEYDMVVRNNEFARAQQIANEIDQLQQQKIAIQAQNVPSNMNQANPQRSEIDSILNKISIR